jgi:hypothetical protein
MLISNVTVTFVLFTFARRGFHLQTRGALLGPSLLVGGFGPPAVSAALGQPNFAATCYDS